MNRSTYEMSAFTVQADVIGALILREIHTRFGRDNVGYLWLLLEPMLLTVSVTAMHALATKSSLDAASVAPFWAIGYTPFIMWRGIISKCEAAFESNKTLIYHRQVTLLDILAARTILEFAAVTAALFIILGLFAALGYGNMPDRPLDMFAGLALLFWFSSAVGLCVACLCTKTHVASRLVHPLVYLSLPISGAFYSMAWLPPSAQRILSWVPLTHMFELIRMGQFADYSDRFAGSTYVVAWCLPLTLIGLLGLRLIRRSMHLD